VDRDSGQIGTSDSVENTVRIVYNELRGVGDAVLCVIKGLTDTSSLTVNWFVMSENVATDDVSVEQTPSEELTNKLTERNYRPRNTNHRNEFVYVHAYKGGDKICKRTVGRGGVVVFVARVLGLRDNVPLEITTTSTRCSRPLYLESERNVNIARRSRLAYQISRYIVQVVCCRGPITDRRKALGTFFLLTRQFNIHWPGTPEGSFFGPLSRHYLL